MNRLNDDKNFQSKHHKVVKYGYFEIFKNSPKIEKKSDRPHFWCEGLYHIDISMCQIWNESVDRGQKFPIKTSESSEIWLFWDFQKFTKN